jgi:Uma2 family endonuclease
MSQPPLTLRRWKRTEYDRLVDLGVFGDEPIELLGGQLVVAEPKGTYHSSATGTVDDAVRAVLPAGWAVRNQLPISLDDESEPEPDLAVVPGRPADYRHAHPERPALVIEVADSSLAFDRERKGSLYARGDIADYWIVNLVDRVLEVYREPAPDSAAVYGWRYRSVVTLTEADVAIPLAFPSARVRVSDLLP